MQFTKYEAAGNDFIVTDTRGLPEMLDLCAQNARILCDRHFGIGADGILVIAACAGSDPEPADAFMHIINADGSYAAMCGNGIRCVARYLYESCGFETDRPLRVATLGGLQTVRLTERNGNGWQLEVAIRRAAVRDKCEIAHGDHIWRGLCIDVGNPHAVFECEGSPRDALNRSGAFLSNHPVFPDRCNIEFVRPVASDTLDFTVFERGVGPTLACGTGCVAAAVAYAHLHNLRDTTIEIRAPGGVLKVFVPRNEDECPLLTGHARRVFTGDYWF